MRGYLLSSCMFSIGVAMTLSLGVVTARSSAEEPGTQGPLDSWTVPHPDWVQVSGQIQHTAVVKRNGGLKNIIAMLAPLEGGQVMVDLGPADNLRSVTLQEKDYVHVRGTPLQSGGEIIIVAGELYADGQVVAIRRPQDRLSGSTGLARQFEDLEEQPLSPAAPGR